jgi:hypothetical protein
MHSMENCLYFISFIAFFSGFISAFVYLKVVVAQTFDVVFGNLRNGLPFLVLQNQCFELLFVAMTFDQFEGCLIFESFLMHIGSAL